MEPCLACEADDPPAFTCFGCTRLGGILRGHLKRPKAAPLQNFLRVLAVTLDLVFPLRLCVFA